MVPTSEDEVAGAVSDGLKTTKPRRPPAVGPTKHTSKKKKKAARRHRSVAKNLSWLAIGLSGLVILVAILLVSKLFRNTDESVVPNVPEQHAANNASTDNENDHRNGTAQERSVYQSADTLANAMAFESTDNYGRVLTIAGNRKMQSYIVYRPFTWDGVFKSCSEDGTLRLDIPAMIIPTDYKSAISAIPVWQAIQPGKSVRFKGRILLLVTNGIKSGKPITVHNLVFIEARPLSEPDGIDRRAQQLLSIVEYLKMLNVPSATAGEWKGAFADFPADSNAELALWMQYKTQQLKIEGLPDFVFDSDLLREIFLAMNGDTMSIHPLLKTHAKEIPVKLDHFIDLAATNRLSTALTHDIFDVSLRRGSSQLDILGTLKTSNLSPDIKRDVLVRGIGFRSSFCT